MNEILIILFRLINFMILIGLFGYLVRKKVIPALAEGIQEAAHQQLLAQQKELLQDGYVQAKQEAHIQEQQAQSLLIKIDQWRADEQQRMSVQQAATERSFAAWQQQRRRTAQEYTQVLAYQRVTEEAFAQLTEELGKQFQSSEACQTFTHQVIQTMKK